MQMSPISQHQLTAQQVKTCLAPCFTAAWLMVMLDGSRRLLAEQPAKGVKYCVFRLDLKGDVLGWNSETKSEAYNVNTFGWELTSEPRHQDRYGHVEAVRALLTSKT